MVRIIKAKRYLLVVRNFKIDRHVPFYTDALSKSPKTSSTLFARHHHKRFVDQEQPEIMVPPAHVNLKYNLPFIYAG